MTRKFIRTVWGYEKDFDTTISVGNNLMFKNNRSSLDREFDIVSKNIFLPIKDFKVYVFGKENYLKLIDLGFDCKLVDNAPYIYPKPEIVMQKTHDMGQTWINKILLLNEAIKDYDEIIYLDWDCQPIKKIPTDLWDKLKNKSDFQVSLHFYRKGSEYAFWRKNCFASARQNKFARRCTASGAFIYCRNKNVFSQMINNMQTQIIQDYWLDESHFSFYIDYINNFKFDWEHYYENYEPNCYYNRHKSFFASRKKNDEIVFYHNITQLIREEINMRINI